MALPVILVDSATGSDTQASGAGPSTALFGTTDASTDGAGTTVTLTAGTDLTNVATDGSHVIFLNDATAGNRNFGKITAKAGSGGATPNVTVANAFGISLSTKSWAIGGKRASIGGTTSKKLLDNNSASGDAMPGWIVELKSGHSETLSATLTPRRPGDTTSGSITLRGESGAATLPLLTFSNNGDAISLINNPQYIVLQDFELQNSNATKTASYAIRGASGGFTSSVVVRGLKIAHSTNKFWRGIGLYYCGYWDIVGNEIGYCAGWGIGHFTTGASSGHHLIGWNVVHHCTSHGIALDTSGTEGCFVLNNIIAFNGGRGLSNTAGVMHVVGNTIHGNASDGIRVTNNAVQAYWSNAYINNSITFNGGYGINYSGTVPTAFLAGPVNGNLFYSNTSGKYVPSDLPSSGESTSDPSGGLASATKDYAGVTDGLTFAVASAVKGTGYPLGGSAYVGRGSTTYSYVDPGAAQRIEPSGGSGGLIIPRSLNGGLV